MRREELQANLDAATAGPLPPEALQRVSETQERLGLLP
jgi:hypothetical protein